MGPYGFFIGGSYLAAALVIGGLVLRAILDHRSQVRALAELEARGTRRRSTAPTRATLAEGAAP